MCPTRITRTLPSYAKMAPLHSTAGCLRNLKLKPRDWKIIDLLNSPMAFQHCILVCMGE